MCCNPEHARAHREGDIHIHDLDFLTLTTTCTQIDLTELFKGGFSTGHGVLREPQDIGSYSALACIAIQSNQNDQHGGQAIASFDYDMAPGVAKTYIKEYRRALGAALELLLNHDAANDEAKAIVRQIRAETGAAPTLKPNKEFDDALRERLLAMTDEATAERMIHYATERGYRETERRTYQAMEAFIHNLNTMHSRAGAQTPFSSINYGMDTSPEGAHGDAQPAAGDGKRFGQRRNADFPDSDFPRQRGRELSTPATRTTTCSGWPCRVSAKRLFPNFCVRGCAVQPASITSRAITRRKSPTWAAARASSATSMTRRARFATAAATCPSRRSTCRALPSRANGDIDLFFKTLDERMELVFEQLDERFEIQARKKVRNYPFLMGEGVWMDSEKLGWDDEVREVLKHGTLSVGFIGLAETLVALIGEHHGRERTQPSSWA